MADATRWDGCAGSQLPSSLENCLDPWELRRPDSHSGQTSTNARLVRPQTLPLPVAPSAQPHSHTLAWLLPFAILLAARLLRPINPRDNSRVTWLQTLPGVRSFISLNTLTLNVKSEKVYTRHGVPISVTGIAQVKIQGQNKEMLAAACQMFLGKTEAEIAHIALETLEGHQRAIMAHMTVEEIYKDRQKFSEQVFKVASSDLVNMGISVVSYTLKDIHDDQDYLHSLGKARTAQVQKDARIGEAEAKRDAGIREAKAKQEKVSAQYLSEIDMAKAQRDYELKKAAYDIEVNTRRAQADLAYQLQVAKTKQQIEEQRVQVQVVERAQQVAVQEQEIARREKELRSKRPPAPPAPSHPAPPDRAEQIMQAEAEAESVRMRGEAEAFAIGARARAEAEQMAKKAEAFQLYQEAAQLDMLLEKLPQVAEEISGPLTSTKKITLVSSGSGAVGAAKVTGEVLDILSRLPESVERLTGISISQVNHKPLRTA
ncbi:PREDICTED: flotillin-1 [Myotis davidii]|uniref:flotillin-1 n=1 Tax=Myotis davidii TaxID=225400 RepID=UPI0003EBCFFF|nr:PREDICTED: flotillin-1 [Myotis davidii]